MLWGVVGVEGGEGDVYSQAALRRNLSSGWRRKRGEMNEGQQHSSKPPKIDTGAGEPVHQEEGVRGGGWEGKTSPDSRLLREKVAPPVCSRTGSRNNSWQQNSRCFIITNDKSIQTIVNVYS